MSFVGSYFSQLSPIILENNKFFNRQVFSRFLNNVFILFTAEKPLSTSEFETGQVNAIIKN